MGNDASLSLLRAWEDLSYDARERCAESVVARFGDSDDPAEVAMLATALADSGERWIWSQEMPKTVDVPSTGGPSSLSTLLCPAILAAAGYWVPKLGVPGATAGALDVLERLAGYQTELRRHQADLALRASGMAHVAAGGVFCPADRGLFDYRVRNNSKGRPALVAASLLSKKLAIGCDNAVLDVRVGPSGNVGPDVEGATTFSNLFIDAATALGIKASCVLSPIDPPASPYFGRLETMRAAVSILRGEAQAAWAERHTNSCAFLAAAGLALANDRAGEAEAFVGSALAQLSSGKAYEVFVRNLVAQGSSAPTLNKYMEVSQTRVPLVALRNGWMSVNARGLRQVLSRLNPSFGDRYGVTLVVRPGDEVRSGEMLAELRHPAGAGGAEVRSAVAGVQQFVTATEQAPAISSIDAQVLLPRSKGRLK